LQRGDLPVWVFLSGKNDLTTIGVEFNFLVKVSNLKTAGVYFGEVEGMIKLGIKVIFGRERIYLLGRER